MMEIRIEQSTDTKVISLLNKTVHDFHAGSYPSLFKPYNPEAIKTWLEEKFATEDWESRIAFYQEKPMGYVLYQTIAYPESPFRYAYKSIYIGQICVLEEFQKNGVGDALLKAVEEDAKEKGMNYIELDYWDKNLYAGKFYMKHGFSPSLHTMIKSVP